MRKMKSEEKKATKKSLVVFMFKALDHQGYRNDSQRNFIMKIRFLIRKKKAWNSRANGELLNRTLEQIDLT